MMTFSPLVMWLLCDVVVMLCEGFRQMAKLSRGYSYICELLLYRDYSMGAQLFGWG